MSNQLNIITKIIMVIACSFSPQTPKGALSGSHRSLLNLKSKFLNQHFPQQASADFIYSLKHFSLQHPFLSSAHFSH